MKSLFIFNDFPPVLGGQSTYYLNLCRALPKDCFIILAPKLEGSEVFDKQVPLPIIRKRYVFQIPVLEKFIKIILPFFYACALLKKEKISLIHCGHILSTGFVGLFIKKLFKCPYYVYTHSADILEYQKYGLIKKCLLSILNNAEKIVANSHFTKEKLLDLNVSLSKIIVIFPRIDVGKFQNDLDPGDMIKKYNLQGKKVILSINRLVERKGNDIVIRAMKNIKEQIPNAVYVVVGGGPYEQKLKDIVDENNLHEDIIFTGRIENEEILKFYKLCDVFVMISREIKEKGDVEGFGIVFVEANSCGKAVIGGDSGGIKDAIIDGETGFLVDPLDEDKVANKIANILSNSELADKLGRQGKERALKELDWRTGVRELDFLFK